MAFISFLKQTYFKISKLVDNLSFYFGSLFPVKENWIVFSSVPDYSDNSYALYEYLKNNNLGEKYHFFWLHSGKNRSRAKSNDYSTLQSLYINCRKGFLLAQTHYYIYTHVNLLAGKQRAGQKTVYLFHGVPFKGAEKEKPMPSRCYPDIVVSTSELACDLTSKFLKIERKRFVSLGFPRNDYFYHVDLKKQQFIKDRFHYSDYKKIVLWMPTFRKSNNNPGLSENYYVSETGLPIIKDSISMDSFNEYLQELGVLLIFKIHPFQAELEVFTKERSNIIKVENSELNQLDVQLYEFVSTTDALLTDYSSIFIDYLLLDKPILFTIDDIEQYDSSRGLIVDNALDYMPGYHIKNIDELKEAVGNLFGEADPYKHERNILKKQFHKYDDGASSRRIADFLDL